jgi:hypothetical protein
LEKNRTLTADKQEFWKAKGLEPNLNRRPKVYYLKYRFDDLTVTFETTWKEGLEEILDADLAGQEKLAMILATELEMPGDQIILLDLAAKHFVRFVRLGSENSSECRCLITR